MNHRLTHYIPPAKFPELEKEFVEPRSDDYFIYWLFGFRCISCKRPATEINEIILRSRSRMAMFWKNRVPLCQTCHQEYHHSGVTDEKVQKLIQLRREYLIATKREKYI